MSEVAKLVSDLSLLPQRPDFASDLQLRSEALAISRKVTFALQPPADAAIDLSLYPAYAMAARIAIDMKLFDLIATSQQPLDAAQLATESGADERLIVRILRPLAALGFVHEVAEKSWSATQLTTTMTAPSIKAAHKLFWDQGNRVYVDMPKFFQENGHVQPEDPRKGGFQCALSTDKETFEYWHEIPEVLDVFNTFMEGNRAGRPSWVEWWPVEEKIFQSLPAQPKSSADPSIELVYGTLLVDIAGGRGHDVKAFKNKFGTSYGRLIVEDLPAVIDDIKDLHVEIEKVKYDFFTLQPIKGAKIYFFHFIMHDWSDDLCLRILSQTVPAMVKGYSKLLLNEYILPDTGCALFACGYDLVMMSLHAAQERTQNQWTTLLEKAGLRIISFTTPLNGGEGIIETELA